MIMVYQQYTNAIMEAYKGRDDVAAMAETAESYRKWLESLEISSNLRIALIEPIETIEEAFKDLAKRAK